MMFSPYKPCPACNRLLSADDAHKLCQKCRHGGKWRRPHWRHQHIEALRRPAMSIMQPREQALQRGLKRYIGGLCKKCGGTERYTADCKCVGCKQGRERANKRTKAASVPELVKARDQEQRDMKARLALRRAEQSARQRRAMGL